MLKAQLDQDLDHNCTPIGPCGSSGAPFKITCATFGYTVVGKGTTSRLWGEVSREADVYRVLKPVQGLAVPVFLGAVNLAQTYFLHGAGRIRHMLLMGWGGESVGHDPLDKAIQQAIYRSVKEIRSLGVVHQDLRPDYILWNAELERALIIDFHRCTLDRRSLHKRSGALKRLRCGPDERHSKRSACSTASLFYRSWLIIDRVLADGGDIGLKVRVLGTRPPRGTMSTQTTPSGSVDLADGCGARRLLTELARAVGMPGLSRSRRLVDYRLMVLLDPSEQHQPIDREECGGDKRVRPGHRSRDDRHDRPRAVA
ncbi:uncharacterized protein BJX67DRAFT_386616 [Aspergillus lucknowensis]|uniref:Protein kinase domain-containing protein n=1 Tax=Aspergillus lucknowensis TaxID=176173 RepID=A0ABR4L5I5_9EURO